MGPSKIKFFNNGFSKKKLSKKMIKIISYLSKKKKKKFFNNRFSKKKIVNYKNHKYGSI